MKYTTTIELEVALAEHFAFLRNTVVPNVSWGVGLHECDIISVTGSGYATEVEIKVSKSDLKADKHKRHGHKSNKIKQLYFAIPYTIPIEFAYKHIPERAGLIVVTKEGKCYVERSPEINNKAKKFTEKGIQKVLRLGAIRIWNLKKKIIKQAQQIKEYRAVLKELLPACEAIPPEAGDPKEWVEEMAKLWRKTNGHTAEQPAE